MAVTTEEYGFRVYSEDTKRVFFKGKQEGLDDLDEQTLGMYSIAVDRANESDVLCFYSSSVTQHNELYCPERFYVVKHAIKPYLVQERNNRYIVKIKHLRRLNIKKLFKYLP